MNITRRHCTCRDPRQGYMGPHCCTSRLSAHVGDGANDLATGIAVSSVGWR